MKRYLLGTVAVVSLVARSILSGQIVAGQTNTDASSDELVHAQGTNMGIYSFTGKCGTCHDAGKGGAPDRYSLNRFTTEEILKSITTGSMAPYADVLSELQMRQLSVYIGGRPFGSAKEGEASAMQGHCSTKAAPVASSKTGSWNGWGYDLTNARFQPAPALTAEQVPKLKLKWAFGFPGGNSSYGEPAVVGGKVFVGSDTGFVYSLAADSGCIHWSFKANAGVRTGIVLGPGKGKGQLAYFVDIRGNLYALNAETGAVVWTLRADTHPFARITGAPQLSGGLLYVAISSLEESGGGNPNYQCCTFRGAVAVYNASTGKEIWKSYTIAEQAKPTTKTSIGTQLWGPAGAGLWSSPTLDLKRHAIYVATGNGYTEPAADTTDAVMAFDMKTGRRLWVNQVRANDAYVRDCPGKYRPNVPTTNRSETCPPNLGPDVDFGNAPILRDLPDGHLLIVIGQKDGTAWGLDPDKQGAVVWSKLVGLGIDKGGGGMQWGIGGG